MKRAAIGRVFSYAYLIGSSLLLTYPLLFMLGGSLITLDQYYRTRFIPIPVRPTLHAYEVVLSSGLEQAIQITMLRVAWYLGLTLLVSLFGGYVFSRLCFPGKSFLFMFFLSGLAIPGILMSLPIYVMLARWPLAGGNNLLGQGGHGLVNQWPSLFILGMVDAFGMFLVKQNYDMLPIEYEEAALMDGASLVTIILCIYAPLLKPVLAALAVITFVGIWNDYFFPFLLVSGNPALTPVALAVQRLINSMASWGSVAMTPLPSLFAGATLMSAPPIILYLLLQRYFVQGLVGVGLKG
jgi:multiple sugar transport system permease protein